MVQITIFWSQKRFQTWFLMVFHVTWWTQAYKTTKSCQLEGFWKIWAKTSRFLPKMGPRPYNAISEICFWYIFLKFCKCYEADFWTVGSSSELKKAIERNFNIFDFSVLKLHYVWFKIAILAFWTVHNAYLGRKKKRNFSP